MLLHLLTCCNKLVQGWWHKEIRVTDLGSEMPDQPPRLSEQEILEYVARCPEPVRFLFEGWLRGTHTLAGDPVDNGVEGEIEMSTVVETAERRHVKVWFGQHVIAQYVAEPALAARYAEAMERRFAGLKITNEQVAPGPAGTALPLPSDRLWGTPPA